MLLYAKTGLSLAEAVRAAVDDLDSATWTYRGRVTIYAFDRDEQHCVTTYARSVEGRCSYWIWTEGMAAPGQREGAVIEHGLPSTATT